MRTSPGTLARGIRRAHPTGPHGRRARTSDFSRIRRLVPEGIRAECPEHLPDDVLRIPPATQVVMEATGRLLGGTTAEHRQAARRSGARAGELVRLLERTL